jgi:hypothetical protein
MTDVLVGPDANERPDPYAERIAVDEIMLDPENPRLVFSETPSQLDLAKRLYEDEALDELMPSLRDNGFFEEEPIVVIPNDGRYAGEKWICVEGNRRLATVKLLLSAKLRSSVGAEDWVALSGSSAARLQVLPTVVYSNRQKILPFLGFRHITGAKKWEPFQKARFIARLVNDGHGIAEIQDIIGDTTQTVKRLYQDYVVYRQMEEEVPFVARQARRKFSLLEVTLNQRPIKSYLGMPNRLPSQAVTGPLVSDERVDELKQVMGWVFGDGSQDPVLSDSRDIPTLAKVLADDDARAFLVATRDLDAAYEYAGGERDYLLGRLGKAERLVAEATGLSAQYADDEDIQVLVGRLKKAVDALSRVVL